MGAMPTFGSDPPRWTGDGGVNINPTGVNGGGGTTAPWGGPPISGPYPVTPVGGGPPTAHHGGGFQPPTGSPGNYGYGTSGNPSPTGTPSMNPPGSPTGPTTSMNPGSAPAMPTVGDNAFSHTFGSGIAPFLAAELNSGGGYNSALTQQAVEAQAAEMQKQAQTGYGVLKSGQGGAGISPNSSVAALEDSNYWSNVTTAENAMTAQEYFTMWNDSQNREAGLLSAELGPLSQNRGGALQWFNQITADIGHLIGGSSYSSDGNFTIGGGG